MDLEFSNSRIIFLILKDGFLCSQAKVDRVGRLTEHISEGAGVMD